MFVAISEEFPTNSTSKVKSGGLLFDRRVARVVTPGTLIDEKFIDPCENNFLLALAVNLNIPEFPNKSPLNIGSTESLLIPSGSIVGLAWLDLSTGDFFTQVTTAALLPSVVARIGAREIVVNEDLPQAFKQGMQTLVGENHHLITFHKCKTEFGVMSDWNSMLEAPVEANAEDAFSSEEKLAGHGLIEYVRDRLPGLETKLQPPARKRLNEYLTIDRSSFRGLEILETARDGLGKGSLLHAVRRTTTKSGTRLLRDRLSAPSTSLPEIDQRLDLVQILLDDARLREEIVQLLGQSYDVQRLIQKFSLNKGDPDDMICMAKAIVASNDIRSSLKLKVGDLKQLQSKSDVGSGELAVIWLLDRLDLDGPMKLAQRVSTTIDEEGLRQKHRMEEDEAAGIAALAQEVIASSALPEEVDSMPKRLRQRPRSNDAKDQEQETDEPWIMCKNASETLENLHCDLDVLRQEKSKMAGSLRDRLQAPSLTLKWTPGLGHIGHIKGANRVSLETVNARVVGSSKSTRSFYLTEWSRLGSRIDQAKVYIRNEEQRIFAELRYQAIKNLVKLRRNAAVIDELDIACSFATLAQEQSLVRPIMNLGLNHKIVGGRHPTVTLGLEEQGRSFVSNDLFLGDHQRMWLVTGPNMGGKSTFLRQNALISILAQVGSYVPAQHAEIGIVDQIFSRIGAADDLFRDQSTFMVEMLETAAILKHATSRSFVIMDEVGRGTTPEDGTAIAYACLHHLHYVNNCRTLFATHFHALADMTQEFEKLGRYCTDILEDEAGSFSFMHRVRQGVNRQSHALKVARLAGLPDAAITVAKEVLEQLDERNSAQNQQDEHLYEAPLLSAAAG